MWLSFGYTCDTCPPWLAFNNTILNVSAAPNLAIEDYNDSCAPQWITLNQLPGHRSDTSRRIVKQEQALSIFPDAALLHSRQVCALSQTKMILLRDCQNYSEELLENIQYWTLWSLTSSSHWSSSMTSWRYLAGQRAQVDLQWTQVGRWSTRSLAFYLMTTMLVCSNSASCKPPCSHMILQSRYIDISSFLSYLISLIDTFNEQNTHASCVCVWGITQPFRFAFLMSAPCIVLKHILTAKTIWGTYLKSNKASHHSVSSYRHISDDASSNVCDASGSESHMSYVHASLWILLFLWERLGSRKSLKSFKTELHCLPLIDAGYLL